MDQLKPPLGCSIMSLIVVCASGRDLLVTRNMESSTKPRTVSSTLEADWMSGAL